MLNRLNIFSYDAVRGCFAYAAPPCTVNIINIKIQLNTVNTTAAAVAALSPYARSSANSWLSHYTLLGVLANYSTHRQTVVYSNQLNRQCSGTPWQINENYVYCYSRCGISRAAASIHIHNNTKYFIIIIIVPRMPPTQMNRSHFCDFILALWAHQENLIALIYEKKPYM